MWDTPDVMARIPMDGWNFSQSREGSRIFQREVAGTSVPWGWYIRINGACLQNVSVWELDPFWKLFHQKYYQCHNVKITMRYLSRACAFISAIMFKTFFIFFVLILHGGSSPESTLAEDIYFNQLFQTICLVLINFNCCTYLAWYGIHETN